MTLHQVNESAWQSLTDTQLGLFWQLGAVPLVYAQLQSQHQMGRLLAYRQRRTPLRRPPPRLPIRLPPWHSGRKR